MLETSQGPAERDLPYQLQWVVVCKRPFTGHHDGQIHARNLQGPAERDLPYIAYARAEGNLEWGLIFLRDTLVVTVVELESGTGGPELGGED